MRGYNLWILLAGLWGALGIAGCQAAGHNGGESVPTFGVNQVPRQSEPPLDDEVVEQVAHHDSTSSEKADEAPEEPAEKSGNLLSKLLPSRDKPQPPRKELPLSGEKPAASGADDDEF